MNKMAESASFTRAAKNAKLLLSNVDSNGHGNINSGEMDGKIGARLTGKWDITYGCSWAKG